MVFLCLRTHSLLYLHLINTLNLLSLIHTCSSWIVSGSNIGTLTAWCLLDYIDSPSQSSQNSLEERLFPGCGKVCCMKHDPHNIRLVQKSSVFAIKNNSKNRDYFCTNLYILVSKLWNLPSLLLYLLLHTHVYIQFRANSKLSL